MYNMRCFATWRGLVAILLKIRPVPIYIAHRCSLPLPLSLSLSLSLSHTGTQEPVSASRCIRREFPSPPSFCMSTQLRMMPLRRRIAYIIYIINDDIYNDYYIHYYACMYSHTATRSHREDNHEMNEQ
jgi:hypothetical protein